MPQRLSIPALRGLLASARSAVNVRDVYEQVTMLLVELERLRRVEDAARRALEVVTYDSRNADDYDRCEAIRELNNAIHEE